MSGLLGRETAFELLANPIEELRGAHLLVSTLREGTRLVPIRLRLLLHTYL